MNKNRIFALSIQILIFCMLLVNQASANPPIVLEGSVLVDGSPAPVGTEIIAMCGGSVVGNTTVDNVGLYSDTRDNRLGISYECETVTLLVNGIEAKIINLSDIDVGEIMVVDLQVSSSTSSSPTEKTSSGGGGGGFVAPPVEEMTTEDVVDDGQPVEEMAMSSTEDPVEETESVPVEEEIQEEVPSADFPTMVGIGSMLMAFCVLIRRRVKD